MELEWCFFFQAEDGIRVAQESRGLGDVYKRQILMREAPGKEITLWSVDDPEFREDKARLIGLEGLSLIHI